MHTDPLDTVERFSNRAADYVKYRPTYPPEAIDAVLDGLGPAGDVRAADVGAGTGISARLLGDRGIQVTAVEPGTAMRDAAAPHANVTWVDGRAEATTLPDASRTLVLCAQSFHWFRAPEALAEFARILAPGGRLALVWNRRRLQDPLTAGYQQALVDAGGDVTVEGTDFAPAIVARGGQFSLPERLVFPNPQRLDLEGFIGRARSASYAPKSGPAGEALIERLRALHGQHADPQGFVTLVHDTEVYRSIRL